MDIPSFFSCVVYKGGFWEEDRNQGTGGAGLREGNRSECDQGTLWAYMKMPQWNFQPSSCLNLPNTHSYYGMWRALKCSALPIKCSFFLGESFWMISFFDGQVRMSLSAANSTSFSQPEENSISTWNMYLLTCWERFAEMLGTLCSWRVFTGELPTSRPVEWD